MTRSLFPALAVALGILPGAPIPSPEGPKDPRTLAEEGAKAYQAKNYELFLSLEEKAHLADPENPRFVYNVACGEALLGRAGDAVRDLESLLAQGLDLGAEQDADFEGIRSRPEWLGFQKKLASLRTAHVRSTTAFTLEDAALIPASLAVDPVSGDVFIGSTRKRKILRRGAGGAVSDFVKEGQDGLWAVGSLGIDGPRHLLIASTSAAALMEGYDKGLAGGAGVFVFDLRTGRLVVKALLARDGKQHFLNQLAIDREGNVLVADSAEAGIYRLEAGADHLEPFISQGLFESTQGLALSDDEKTLYVSDWTDGLWALDMKSKERRRIPAPKGVWLGGLDGLTRIPGGFLSVQIGVQPARVLKLVLDDAQGRLREVETLEIAHPDYQGPVQGTLSGKTFLYVANSELDLVDPKTGTLPMEKARPAHILALPF
jgi:sugar lactone lactonase YvrE